MFERVRARKTEKGVAVFMRALNLGNFEPARGKKSGVSTGVEGFGETYRMYA
jgi:hypothetical protein